MILQVEYTLPEVGILWQFKDEMPGFKFSIIAYLDSKPVDLVLVFAAGQRGVAGSPLQCAGLVR